MGLYWLLSPQRGDRRRQGGRRSCARRALDAYDGEFADGLAADPRHAAARAAAARASCCGRRCWPRRRRSACSPGLSSTYGYSFPGTLAEVAVRTSPGELQAALVQTRRPRRYRGRRRRHRTSSWPTRPGRWSAASPGRRRSRPSTSASGGTCWSAIPRATCPTTPGRAHRARPRAERVPAVRAGLAAALVRRVLRGAARRLARAQARWRGSNDALRRRRPATAFGWRAGSTRSAASSTGTRACGPGSAISRPGCSPTSSATVAIERPIYVSGLARSGSTILLELLARHEAVATHRYRDYPPVFTPYLWNRLLERTPQRAGRAGRAQPSRTASRSRRRARRRWKRSCGWRFFPQLHDPAASRGARPRDPQPGVRELLPRPHPQAAAGARRPPLSRQGQLQRHPARLPARAVPRRALRDPGARAALAHRLADEAARAVLRGRARQPGGGRATCSGSAISSSGSTGARSMPATPRSIEQVLACWRDGAEVEGWARYWSHIYGYVADRLEANPSCATPR